MTIIASPYATPLVFEFVNTLNRMLFDSPSSEPLLAGTKRRIAREKAQAKAMKKWHASAEKGLSNERSRQVIRRMKRQADKSKRSRLKTEAMRQYIPGGSAAVY